MSDDSGETVVLEEKDDMKVSMTAVSEHARQTDTRIY
jgi:hypothetical protein